MFEIPRSWKKNRTKINLNRERSVTQSNRRKMKLFRCIFLKECSNMMG